MDRVEHHVYLEITVAMDRGLESEFMDLGDQRIEIPLRSLRFQAEIVGTFGIGLVESSRSPR